MAKKKKKASAMPKLLFVDSNIWLDFYRGRSEAALALLNHVESVGGRLVVTYQLEMEYKKNRQAAILEGMAALKGPGSVPQLGVFSKSREITAVKNAAKASEARIKTLKGRLRNILSDPGRYDPVRRPPAFE